MTELRQGACDPFIRTTFPDGSTFVTRIECSGVVLDAKSQPFDAELATCMLLIKARKLWQRDIGGSA